MTRPLQLAAVTAVFLLGVAFAVAGEAMPQIRTLMFSWLVLLLLASSIHLINEYADFEVDAHSQRTPFSGGSGALAESGLRRSVPAVAAWITFILGSLAALGGFLSGILPPAGLLLLAIGVFLGWMYSVRPLALEWRGWGELDNALAGGLVLPLFGLVVAGGRLGWESVLVWTPFVGLVFLNLLATTWADRTADHRFGKRTLATRWRPASLRLLYLVVLGGSILVWILLGFRGEISESGFWLGALVLPLTWWGWHLYTLQDDPLPSVAAMGGFVLIQLAALTIQNFSL